MVTLFLPLFCFFHYVQYSSGDCTLSLKHDFGTPSPVFLRNGDYLAPDVSGAISLKRSETIQVACPGTKKFILLGNVTTQRSELEAHCIINSTFRVERWIGAFKDVKCNHQPWFSVEDTRESCYRGSKLYRVGYDVGKKFHTLYEACFDHSMLATMYVKHHVTPTNIYVESGRKRPKFVEGDVFGKVRVSQLYAIKGQKARLDAVLGAQMGEKYVTKDQYLARGHLAPRADFSLFATQRASFHYINAAPQWQRGNSGDWAALEDAVRRLAHLQGTPLTVYTGTHGVFSVPAKDGNVRPVYLAEDDNNNNIVPVPMYFYKVIHDPREKSATAFVSINSSFHNKTMIKSLQFCEDICDNNPKYSWLTWRSNDGTHSFCCSFYEFQQKIDHLPIVGVMRSIS